MESWDQRVSATLTRHQGLQFGVRGAISCCLSTSATLHLHRFPNTPRFTSHLLGYPLVVLLQSKDSIIKMNRLLALVVLSALVTVRGFVPLFPRQTSTAFFAANGGEAEGRALDPSETVARRIIVKGAVQGGYYRSCVLNEV